MSENEMHPCQHCGSNKGFWFSRCLEGACDSMHYVCEECGKWECSMDCETCSANPERANRCGSGRSKDAEAMGRALSRERRP
jgi:hypothetical protein